MSRLTGTDAYGLMEAYGAVYAPQELTEEQVWEEVETWVNSLLEEGYDLSDYTWEEMYESYLEEQGGQRGSGSSASQTNQSVRIPGGRTATRVVSDLGSSLAASTKVPTSSGPRNVRGGGQTKPTPAPAVSAPAKPAAPAPTTNTRTPSRLTPGVTTVPIRPRTPAAAPAPANRPAPAATTKVTPTKPTATATPTPAPSASPARPSLSSQADEIRKMRAGSLARQGKTLEAATVSGTTKPAYQANSFDPFDIVKGHLIDEGYADTEEAALVIMANMSEEWKQSIVEGMFDFLPKTKTVIQKPQPRGREFTNPPS